MEVNKIKTCLQRDHIVVEEDDNKKMETLTYKLYEG